MYTMGFYWFIGYMKGLIKGLILVEGNSFGRELATKKYHMIKRDALDKLSRTNTRVFEEEELMTINIDSSEQSRARLQLQPTLGARAPPHLTSGGGLRLA